MNVLQGTFRFLISMIFFGNQNIFSDLPSAKTVPPARILTEAMLASVLTDGLAMTAARILTIVWMQRVSTAQPVLMGLEALVADARPERLDYCAI